MSHADTDNNDEKNDNKHVTSMTRMKVSERGVAQGAVRDEAHRAIAVVLVVIKICHPVLELHNNAAHNLIILKDPSPKPSPEQTAANTIIHISLPAMSPE